MTMRKPVLQKWKAAVERLTLSIKYVLLSLSHYAACYPYVCVGSTIVISIALAIAGWQTNFLFESRENELWKPLGSMSAADGAWLENPNAEKYYSPQAQAASTTGGIHHERNDYRRLQGGEDNWLTVSALMHKNGDNVVTKEGADR